MGLTFIQVLLFEVDVISRSTLKFINHMQSSFVTLTIAVSKIGFSKQYFFKLMPISNWIYQFLSMKCCDPQYYANQPIPLVNNESNKWIATTLWFIPAGANMVWDGWSW